MNEELLPIVWHFCKQEFCKHNHYILGYRHSIISSSCFFCCCCFIMFIYECTFIFTTLLFITFSNDIVEWKFISKTAEYPLKELAFPAGIFQPPESLTLVFIVCIARRVMVNICKLKITIILAITGSK